MKNASVCGMYGFGSWLQEAIKAGLNVPEQKTKNVFPVL